MSNTIVQTMPEKAFDNKPLSANEVEDLKKSFAADGYFVVRQVVSPEQLTILHKSLVEEFEKMKASGSLFSGGGLVSGHLNCFPGEGSRFVYETLQDRGFIDLIKQLDPKIDRMPNVGCNYNLPGSATQHWHADRDFANDFMIANVAVVDTVIENGAIDMIPGTHKEFYKYTRFVMERTDRNSLRLPMKKGDLLVRTSNVWHRGMPNLTSVPRPMLALTWEDGGSKLDDPFMADGGSIRFKPNWFQPTRAGRMRERLFVKVPLAYTAFRFARSLRDKNY